MANDPNWKQPGTKPEKPPTVIEAALAVMGENATVSNVNSTLLSAVIVAQALDRASSRLIEAAAVNQYRRT